MKFVQQFYNTATDIAVLAILPPFVIGLLNYRRVFRQDHLMYLFAFIVLCAATELTNTQLTMRNINNAQVGNVYRVLTFLLFTGIVAGSGVLPYGYVRALNYLRVAVAALFVLTPFGLWTGIVSGTAGCILLSFCFLFIYYRIENFERLKRGESDSLFSAVSAIFVYSSATFFVFMLRNLPGITENQFRLLWSVTIVSNLVFYTFIARLFWLTAKK